MRGGVSIKTDRLACLPLSFMAEQALIASPADFENDTLIYRDIMCSALWLYQLHSYHAMVRRFFGASVATRVIARQQAIFDVEQPGAAALIRDGLQMVATAVSAVQPGKDGAGRVPELAAERRVARLLLLSLPESPDYCPQAHSDRPRAYGLPGIDTTLATLLATGQRELTHNFAPLFQSQRLN